MCSQWTLSFVSNTGARGRLVSDSAEKPVPNGELNKKEVDKPIEIINLLDDTVLIADDSEPDGKPGEDCFFYVDKTPSTEKSTTTDASGSQSEKSKRKRKKKKANASDTENIPQKLEDNNEVSESGKDNTSKKKKKKRRSSIKGQEVKEPQSKDSDNDTTVITLDSEGEEGSVSVVVISDDEIVLPTRKKAQLRQKKVQKKKKSVGKCWGIINSEFTKSTFGPKHVNKRTSSESAGRPSESQVKPPSELRPIIIDGSNVAFGHGRKESKFSSMGLKLCVDHFKDLGHKVTAFVPQFRKRHPATMDQEILEQMEKDGSVVFTPSRRIEGKMVVPYDDRFIVEYAHKVGGVIVTRDNYSDILNEKKEWAETINKRILNYTWVCDTLMFPQDPLGRGGPTLQEFLSFDK